MEVKLYNRGHFSILDRVMLLFLLSPEIYLFNPMGRGTISFLENVERFFGESLQILYHQSIEALISKVK